MVKHLSFKTFIPCLLKQLKHLYQNKLQQSDTCKMLVLTKYPHKISKSLNF